MGGGLTSQYKHSANFLGDDIIVNKLSCWRGKIRHKVATDVSWGIKPIVDPKVWKKSPFVDQRRVFLHWRASAVMLFVLFYFFENP